MSDPLILHVKGTEQTTALPRHIVRAGIAQGQITRSQLIWSPNHNSWKQVRELPDLWPSQKLAPAPAIQASGVLPTITAASELKTSTAPGHVPAPRPVDESAPKVAGTPVVAPKASMVVEEEPESGFGFLKIVCFGVGLIILLAVGANYILVDQPLTTNLGKTSYGKVFVFGHLGAFVQPNAMVIHIPTNKTVTSTNLVDFLCNLAQSTPLNPSKNVYDSVCFTTGLMAEYKMTGFAWKEFGEMKTDDELARKTFLMEQITDASGQPLGQSSSAVSPDAQDAARADAWKTFVAYFTKS